MRPAISLLIILFSVVCQASAQLLSPINSGVLPNNSDPVCSTPYYLNTNFDTSGYDVGQTVNDFTLFDAGGNPYQLGNILSLGKPILLITGSITCPVFRNNLSTINAVFTTYSADVNTAIIYVIEAHPTDTSPYFGNINITSQNLTEGVLLDQPNTYAERKALVDTLLQNYTVAPPVYIDGPCNEWWHSFGPAPQNAYLIDTNGVVMVKQGWFDQFPQDIFCDIDSALSISSGECNTDTGNGSFIFDPDITMVYGEPGEILYGTGKIINNSAEDVLILVRKLQEIYPAGWESSFCMEICYANSVDSTTINLAANDTMLFSIDFHTSVLPDAGSVRVGFRNLNNPSNQFAQWFYGYTTDPVGIEQTAPMSIQVYPNPTPDIIHVVFPAIVSEGQLTIVDMQGRIKHTQHIFSKSEMQINLEDLEGGMYILRYEGEHTVYTSRFIRQ
jgi:hypothetical protein